MASFSSVGSASFSSVADKRDEASQGSGATKQPDRKASTVSEPTACSRARSDSCYCSRCDLLVGLDGFHVVEVAELDGRRGLFLRVVVESPPRIEACRECGVVAHSHGRRTVRLVDTPCFGRPVELVWRKRTWRCAEAACPTGSFTEQHEDLARPRALLTARACRWAVAQLRREHASVQGLARQLGTAWRTVWESIKPLLEARAGDETRFAGVTTLGVDEHVWHHVSTKPVEDGGRGPKELTVRMVDLTRDADGMVRARLLDLVPGRSGAAYSQWLRARNEAFRDGVEVATLDPFHGYKNAIDDQLDDAVAVLDAFHVVKLGTHAVDEVRRRVQQEIHGHRGRKHDPLYGIRMILRCGQERLTDKQRARPNGRSWPTSDTTRSTWPGSAPSSSATPTGPRAWPKVDGSPSKFSPHCRPARSPRSSDSARP